jgi:flagellar motility protein MotE (MotC chaperone)
MKEKIVYGLIFVFLFAVVSAGMIYFNSIYKNIFAFDFTPRAQENELAKKNLAKADSLKTDSLKVDSLKTNVDSTQVKENVSTAKTDLVSNQKLETKEQKKEQKKEEVAVQTPFRVPVDDKIKAKKDSIYNEWVKQTVKLYESMDSKKAAKVIVNYSDNIARDILLKMKKKKAAEILAELKPDVVTRIISVN